MSTNNSRTKLARSGRIRLATLGASVPLLAVATVLAPAALATANASAAAPDSPASVTARASFPQHFSGGGVTVAGKNWLGGHGVNVYRGRMCGELAVRLYETKGWGSIRASYAGIQTIGQYSTGVAFHRNGSGYVPVPGDVVVEGGASYGHVSVVDSVKRGKIVTVEENANPSGWHTYSWSGKKASGAYSGREVTGFVHSPKNKNTNP